MRIKFLLQDKAKQLRGLGRTLSAVRAHSTEHPPILIYQMGKVASSSIYESLVSCWPGIVAHYHHLDQLDAKWIYKNVYKRGLPINVISLVREPTTRNISAFFQNFDYFVGIPFEQSTHSVDELIEIFLKKYPHDVPLIWFDDNLRKHFALDVYTHPFPDDGFATYQHNNVRCLILRAELPDAKKQAAVSQFLKLTEFELVRANVGAGKPYAETYREFKDSIEMPKWYKSMMYDSQYFQHFYAGEYGESSI